MPCKNSKSKQKRIPEGMTHQKAKPCAFKKGNHPTGDFAPCCSLWGEQAHRELLALGEYELAGRMCDNVTSAEGARDFARELAAGLARLKDGNLGRLKPKGAGWDEKWDEAKEEWVWENYSTFDEACDRILKAALWYEKVGQLGFGVRARY